MNCCNTLIYIFEENNAICYYIGLPMPRFIGACGPLS